MRAGALRDTIVFQAPTTTVNDVGEGITSWSTFATKRAAKTPFRSDEFRQLGQLQSEVITIFTLRYLEGITHDMRILSDGKYYDIGSILDKDNLHKTLIITATEKSYVQS